jgi:hypothetical protein
MRIHHDIIQGSEQWNVLRRRLTASRMSEVLTPTGKLSKQAESLAVEIALHEINGYVDALAFMGNKYTDWGQATEAEARQVAEILLAEQLGSDILIKEVGFVEDDTGLIGCSPDGLIYEDSLISGLELKCPKSQTHASWILDGGGLPGEHKPQVHACMVVTGLPCWYFMSYYPGLKPMLVRVERDDYTAKVEAAAAEFAILLEKTKAIVREKLTPVPLL